MSARPAHPGRPDRPGRPKRPDRPDRHDPRPALGRRGEDAVAHWYEARGATVLDRNWRVTGGELDLVVRDGATLVFCEVKTRRTETFGSPFDAVTVRKQQRLRALARRWLAEHRPGAPTVRFDVAAVWVRGDGRPVVEVLVGAF